MFKSLKNCFKAIACIAAAISLTAGCSAGKHTVDYAKDYVDIYGMTAEELADKRGMSFEDLLEYYDLPEDLPRDLNSNALNKTLTVGKVAELSNMTFDKFKESMGWDDNITENTRFGIALDQTQLKYCVGEENLEAFKTEYGFGDEITAETLYGDVRVKVEEHMKEKYAESKAAAEAADTDADVEPAEGEAPAADGTADNTEAAPAADEAAEVTEAPAEKQ